MSHYLDYCLRKAGLERPGRILIAPGAEPWAGPQLLDEFRFLYPEADVRTDDGAALKPDLYVLAFTVSASAEWGPSRRKRIREAQPAMVMLYGLPRRSITLLPPERLARHLRLERAASAIRAAKKRLKAWIGLGATS
jgi:hypothetical protein